MRFPRRLVVLAALALLALVVWLAVRAVLEPPVQDARRAAQAEGSPAEAGPVASRAERSRASPAEPAEEPLAPGGTASPQPAEPRDPAQTLTVLVLDSTGRPAPGAAIAVHDVFIAAAGRLDQMVVATGTTDDAGRAPLALRGASDVLVHARLRGESAAVKTSLFKRTEATAEIRLAPSASISGRVVFPDDAPVDGAPVVAFLENRRGTLVLRSASRDDGKFVIEDVPADRLESHPVIRVERGHGHWGVEVRPTPEEARSGALVIRVDRTTLLRGRLLSEDAEPVARAEVAVYTERWNWGTSSDTDGRFEGEFPRGRGFVEIDSDVTLRHRIEPFVVDGPALDLGDVVLPRGVAISGIALDRDGRPVVRASVRLRDADGRARFTRTDDAGRFTVDHIAPGVYDVVAQAAAEREVDGAPEGDAGEAVGVTAPTRDFVVRLGSSRFVSVRVHWPDGQPSSFGFTLRIRGEDGRGPPDTTRRAGGPASDLVRFRVAAPGTYDLTLESPGFEPVTFDDVRVEEGRETFLDATLRRKP